MNKLKHNELRKELEKVVKELAEVNKELESFSYSVSHDLRAPLRAIKGFTEILKEEYSGLFDNEGNRILTFPVTLIDKTARKKMEKEKNGTKKRYSTF